MKTTTPNFWDKTTLLLKGNIHDFSKLLKFMQYICVVNSEFNLSAYHLRGVGIPKFLDGLVGG